MASWRALRTVLRGRKLVSKLNLYPARARLPRARFRICTGAQQCGARHGHRPEAADAPAMTQQIARTEGPLSAGSERHHPMMLVLRAQSMHPTPGVRTRRGAERAPRREPGRSPGLRSARGQHRLGCSSQRRSVPFDEATRPPSSPGARSARRAPRARARRRPSEGREARASTPLGKTAERRRAGAAPRNEPFTR
jgi:hypothetical protein